MPGLARFPIYTPTAWFFQGIFVYAGWIRVLDVAGLLLGGLAAGFLMYYLGIWSPGDSKLFWGISLALPPTLYTVGGWRYPPFVIVTNTFVPYFMVVMVYILLKTSGRQKLQAARIIFEPKFLLRLTLSFVAFMGFSSLISQFSPLKLDYFSSIIFFVVLFALLERWVDYREQFYIILPFSVVAVIMASQDIAFFVRMLFITLGLFLVLRFFVATLGSHLFVKEINVSELRAGAIPANIIVKNKHGQYAVQEVDYTSFVNIASRPKEAEIVMDMCPEGLPSDKVAELQDLAEHGSFASFGNRVKVQDRMPFAPIILCGTVLTVLCRGVFIVPLLSFLYQL
jgi:hypothetical protein